MYNNKPTIAGISKLTEEQRKCFMVATVILSHPWINLKKKKQNSFLKY